jgi:peroxiredoxin/mono/diheme cytochrome c family protein
MYRIVSLGVLALCVLGFAKGSLAATPAGGTSKPGTPIGDFCLKDLQGVTHSLSEMRDAPAVAVVFMGVECPLAKLYAPRLNELAEEFQSRGVRMVAIDSNAQDSLAEMQHFARTYGLAIPFLKDPGNVVADQFAAERTPEVFLLDRDRVVRYRGRIDDQYGFQAGVGYQRPEAVKRDLAEATVALLDGKSVSEPTTRAPGCLIGRVHAANEKSEVTFSKQISRLFQDRCVKCHREGEIAPFSLTDYDEVVGWAPMIAETVRENRMPPWHASPKFGHFSNDDRLSDAEKALIATWVENGAPQGDPRDLPAPKQYTQGWQISKPDCIVPMSDKPFTVPAEGKVEYQYFVADPGFTEDKWVSAAECRPGNNAVVHHIIVFVVPPGEEAKEMGEGMGARDLLAGTAPGNPPAVLPTGMAKRIKAGSKFLFQMHYTANGSEQQDVSRIGLVFADPKTVTREVRTDLAINTSFNIPAGCSDQMVESWHTFSRDTLILSFMPHMHLRGSAFRYDLQYPDGKVATLLDIPKYDFNWQNNYDLAEPLLVPKGTKMHCVAHFDNSADNLANPDPSVAVGWGEQTWEEMMIGWFVKASAEETPNLPAALVAKEKAREVRRAEKQERHRLEREAKAAAAVNESAAK